MHFRAIKRVFLAKAALHRYNKRNKTSLTQSDISILFAAAALSKDTSITAIHSFLIRLHRTNDYNNIAEYVRKLVDLAYLDKIKGQAYNRDKINITISGLNVLQEYEKILRIERYDR